jgi:hypothetical protein
MRKPIGFLPTLVLALASVIVSIGPVLAAPITYTEQGTGTGSLDGIPFTDASILLTMTNDTANVTSGPPPLTFINTGTATVSVNGGPSEIFTNPVVVFSTAVAMEARVAGFGIGQGGTVSILNTVNPVFATYNLTTSIGPISGFDGSRPFTFPTSSGDFRIDNAEGRDTTFTATTATTAPDFELFENSGSSDCPGLPSGSTGCFDLVNNTNSYFITGFDVGNGLALSNSTTRTNWGADITSVDYGGGPEQSFTYFDEGGSGTNPLGNGSDDSFFFTAGAVGSPFQIFANGPNGPVSCIGTSGGGCDPPAGVPEPGTLWLLGAGLAALRLMRWRTC